MAESDLLPLQIRILLMAPFNFLADEDNDEEGEIVTKNRRTTCVGHLRRLIT